jgi:hypothetical protein
MYHAKLGGHLRGDAMADQYRYLLDEKEIPKAWYNVVPDLPRPLPPVLHPGTFKPVGPEDLSPILPMALILQEVSQESWIEIPEPVREVYKLWRPTPLIRAHRLEPPKYALGHAIGLELHERPYLFADVAEPLHEHAALVIEPSGRIGDRVARVGDTWLVEAAGGRDLTSAARSLDIR